MITWPLSAVTSSAAMAAAAEDEQIDDDDDDETTFKLSKFSWLLWELEPHADEVEEPAEDDDDDDDDEAVEEADTAPFAVSMPFWWLAVEVVKKSLKNILIFRF